MRKIDAQTARILEDIIQDNDQSFEFNGRQYKIIALDNNADTETTVAEDVEKYPDLKQKLLQAKKDIENENYFTTDEMREMIRKGQI
ncbi:hypothetical protein [Lentibacillus sp.]|uniref:hypothetical protein n=1 Tax=Lentibacillus sp. TaxID=1925746 RepID=UPI002B4B5910|nr:hypothetical protein [Lentibacillus sp.]HLS10509.1 hypothetical protein [Lentibacillus sp.]